MQLDAPVTEYGRNLSQGQSHLLCLGRALLRACPVLLLDEATSGVDHETDQQVQKTLCSAFAGRTLLTISHRVHSIAHSDLFWCWRTGAWPSTRRPEIWFSVPTRSFLRDAAPS